MANKSNVDSLMSFPPKPHSALLSPPNRASIVYRWLQEEKAEDVSEELIADVKALAYLLFLSECRSALVLKRSPALVPTAVRGSLSIPRWCRWLAQRGYGRGRRRATRELEGGETSTGEQNRQPQNRLAFFRPPKIART